MTRKCKLVEHGPKYNNKENLRNCTQNCSVYKFSYKKSNMLMFLGFRQDLFSEIRSPAELNGCSLGTLVAVIVSVRLTSLAKYRCIDN